MSEVIDALKRLERVGGENSATTRKLMDAADRLAAKIVEQFDERDKYVIEVAPRFHGSRYSILNGRLCNGESRWVAETRDTALDFARDIASGLLDAVTENLEQRNAESRHALAAVEGALRRFR